MHKVNDRKEAVSAYKKRKVVGGVFRYVHASGWQGAIRATVEMRAEHNKLQFAKRTGNCTDMEIGPLWKSLGAEGFAIEEMELMEKKEDQPEREFREEIKVLLSLWQNQ